MLYAYINGIYTEINDLKVDRVLNQSGKLTFTAPATRFPDPLFDFQNVHYKVYFKDNVVLSDGLIETSTAAIKNNTIIDTIAFTGGDELGILASVGAKSNAKYQNQNILFIIDDLLSKTTDWRLGYTYNVDITQTFTVDLQDKDTLLSQIKQVCELVPDFYFRYGGTFDDWFLLDVGPLNTRSTTTFIQGLNLESIKRLPQPTKKIYEMEGFGGSMETPAREIYLSDAADYDATLLTHVRYPIVNKSDGTWVIRDLLYPNGDSILKRFNDVKPTSNTPSAGEIEEAGYALWQACVSEFQKSNEVAVKYEASSNVSLEYIQHSGGTGLVGLTNDDEEGLLNDEDFILLVSTGTGGAAYWEEVLSSPDILNLYPGDSCFFSGNVSIFVFNYHTNNFVTYDAYKLKEYIFLSDVSFYWKPNKLINVVVKTGNVSYPELYDERIILAKKAEEGKTSSVLGVGYPVPEATGVELVTDTHSGEVADTTMSDGSAGKIFALPMPAVPLGTTELRFSLYSTNRNIIIETVQDPVLPASGYIAKVRLEHEEWNVDNSATLYGVFIFR